MRILAINPGSTSTKIAVYEDEQLVFEKGINHSFSELEKLKTIAQQLDYRRNHILTELVDANIDFNFDAIVGRAGLLGPIEGGVYEVNDRMYEALQHPVREHPCNFGSILAYILAQQIEGCMALTADSGMTDEYDEISRISGFPLIEREPFWHTLNQRAIARTYAKQAGKKYEELNLIVCHLGGGTSIAVHRHGRAVDSNNGMGDDGPFSITRSGSLPARGVVELCFSGKYDKHTLDNFFFKNCGVRAYLGTSNMFEVMDRVEKGDYKAKLVMDALILQTAKEIAGMSTVLYGKVDAILLTGGLCKDQYIREGIVERIQHIAPVHVFPGEDEMKALAGNALAVLRGELPIKEFNDSVFRKTKNLFAEEQS